MSVCCCKSINGRPPRQPDRCWSWMVCLVGTIAFTVTIGLSFTYAVFLPVFMDQFHSSIEELSAIGSIAQALVFFCVPLSYRIMGTINFRWTAMLSIVLCASSLLVTSFVEKNATIFFISYSLPYGLGCSLLYASCIYATTRYFKKRQNLALGILFSGFSLGMLTLGPLLQVLIDRFGLKNTFQILAGTVSCLFPVIFVTFDTNIKDSTVTVAEENTEDTKESRAKIVMKILVIFTRPAYVITVMVIFLECFGTNMVSVHLVNYCIEAGITAQQGANQFTVIGVLSLVSTIVSGRVMDHKAVNPLHVTQVAAFLMSLTCFLIQLADQYHHFIVISFFYGIGNGIFRTSVGVLFLNTVDPHQVKYAWPIAEVLTSIGNGSGAPFIGFIIDITNSFDKGFATGAGIFALAFLIPFLQYCFKPWRKIPEKSTNRVEVAAPTSDNTVVIAAAPPENSPVDQEEHLTSCNINYAFKESEFETSLNEEKQISINVKSELTEKTENNNRFNLDEDDSVQEVPSYDTKF